MIFFPYLFAHQTFDVFSVKSAFAFNFYDFHNLIECFDFNSVSEYLYQQLPTFVLNPQKRKQLINDVRFGVFINKTPVFLL